MSKRATKNTYPSNIDWRVPLRGEKGEWYPIVRVGRHIPFGYKQDENDQDLLIPIPEELELLEKAKLLLKEYSIRNVANWLSKESGRYISHVGLEKRVRMEEKRRRAFDNYQTYVRKYKEAARKAKTLQENRIGGKGTRKFFSDDDESTSSSEGT